MMKYSICAVLTLLCLCLASKAYGQPAKLQGKLMTELGQPVGNVELLPINGLPKTVEPDGKFVIFFPPSVIAGWPTQLKVSNDWVITVPYRGRFSTVHVSDSLTEEVRVVKKGSRSLISPENLARLVQEATLYRNFVVPTQRENRDLVRENNGLSVELGIERDRTAKLESEVATLSVYRQYAEDAGFTLEALKQALDDWASSKESSDDDLQKTAKAAYRGDWVEQGRLADLAIAKSRKTIEDSDRRINEQNQRKRNEVRNLIYGLLYKSDSARQQNQLAEALKPLDEIEELFASGRVSKELFREEWGVSRITLAIGQFALAVRQVDPPAIPSVEVPPLLAKTISNCREALLTLKPETNPGKWGFARMLLAAALSISASISKGPEREQLLAEAIESLDVAFPVFNAPSSPTTCDCPPEGWISLRSGIALAYATIAREVGAERGMRMTERAASLLDGIVIPPLNESSRQLVVRMHLQLSVSHLSLATAGKQPDAQRIGTAIKSLRTTLAGLSRDELPHERATGYGVLGFSYLMFARYSRENRSDNQALAIKAYEEAAIVPAALIGQTDWAAKQSKLGRALLITGWDRTEGLTRISRAVKIFEEMVKFQTTNGASTSLAEAHLDLGIGLLALGRRLGQNESLIRLSASTKALQHALGLFDENRSPEGWVQAQVNLGLAYAELGRHYRRNSRINFDISRKAFEQALRVYSEKGKKTEWALTQANFGLALLSFAETEPTRVDDVRAGLKAFEEALTIIGEEMPFEWAQLQADRARALTLLANRIGGSEGESNLAKAFSGLQEALRFYTEEETPFEWASTQGNIGLAYFDLAQISPAGRVDNLRAAIKAFEEALKVFSKEKSSEEWAVTHGNLGRSWEFLAETLRDESSASAFQNAFDAFDLALKVYDEKKAPYAWAQTQGNLGVAHLAWADLGLPDGETHLEISTNAFEQALRVLNEKEYPEDWAETQSHLGRALGTWGQGIGPEGLNKLLEARTAFQKALTVYAEKTYEWALIKTHLGHTLFFIAQYAADECKQRLDDALTNLEQALPVFSDPRFQVDRARLQYYRSGAFLMMSTLVRREERERRLKAAVEACEDGLSAVTFDTYPSEWADLTINLANAMQDLGRPQEAVRGYEEVLSKNEKDHRAIDGLAYINHEVYFNYSEAFRLSEILVRANPDMVGVRADFAEKHFTTHRFDECRQLIVSLLQEPRLEPDIEIALRAIEIANLVAVGELSSIDSRLQSLIDLLTAQPPKFEARWIFGGVKNFISKNKNLAKHRRWLLRLFDAVKLMPREGTIELTKLRNTFKANVGSNFQRFYDRRLLFNIAAASERIAGSFMRTLTPKELNLNDLCRCRTVRQLSLY